MKNACKLFIPLITFHLWLITPSFSQNYRWAYGFGSDDGNSHGNAIATDANANVYATGYFGDTIDFDPTTGIFLLNSDYQKMFVTKYDSAGAYQWAITTEGAGLSSGNSIAVNNTGVYVTGEFYGTLDFDPSPATFNLQSNNQSADVFIAKYDLGGSLVWAIKMGGPENDVGNSIAVDDMGNVYISGDFRDIADFDPGAGVLNLFSDTIVDTFFGKYNTNGNLIWVHDLCDTGNFTSDIRLSLDKLGALYIAGSLHNTIDFDRGNGVYNISALGIAPDFVCKYDTSGSFIWASSITSTGNLGVGIAKIFVDNLSSSGEFYTCGAFSGTSNFDLLGGTLNLTSLGSYDIFFARYSSSGSNIWIKQIGSAGGAEYARYIQTDIYKNVFMTGNFASSTDFDPNNGVVNITVTGSSDMYFAKYDSTGSYLWARGMGGLYTDVSNEMTIDGLSNQFITGYFTNSMDFDPGSGSVILSPAISQNIFIAKYADTFTSVNQLNVTTFSSLNVYPNPSTRLIKIDGYSGVGNALIRITDCYGKNLFINSNYKNQMLDISHLPVGLYIVEINNFSGHYVTKFIKN